MIGGISVLAQVISEVLEASGTTSRGEESPVLSAIVEQTELLGHAAI
jgi:hypothetical protein